MKKKMLERTGVSCMALAMLFMMNGGVNIHAEEETAGTPLPTQSAMQEKAAFKATLDTAGLKNAEASIETAADGKLILTVRAKEGYYFADDLTVSSDDSLVNLSKTSDCTNMVHYYRISISGNLTNDYTIKVKGEAAVLTSSKLILNTDNVKNATAALEKSEGVTPLDNVILTLKADDRNAFESSPYVIINGEKRTMHPFADEKTYTLSIQNIHADTIIEVYGTAASTEVSAVLEKTEVSGYVNEMIASYGTITLKNTAFHQIAKGTDISSWFNSLPKGVQVLAIDGVEEGNCNMQIKFSGKPKQMYRGSIDLMIPYAYITSKDSLKVHNSDSNWFINKRSVNTKAPVITKGNQNYVVGSNKPLELICSGDRDDLYGIFINGSAISGDFYTITSGRTVLTLQPEYLNALEKGSYTVRFTYNNGQYAETKFTVGEKKSAQAETEAAIKADAAPNTADATSTGSAILLFLLSGAVLIRTGKKRMTCKQ